MQKSEELAAIKVLVAFSNTLDGVNREQYADLIDGMLSRSAARKHKPANYWKKKPKEYIDDSDTQSADSLYNDVNYSTEQILQLAYSTALKIKNTLQEDKNVSSADREHFSRVLKTLAETIYGLS